MKFTRDGRALVRTANGRVVIRDVHTRADRDLAVHGVRSVAAFDGELWCASERLTRIAIDGRVLGEHDLPPDAQAQLIAAPVGPAAALWTAAAPVLVLDDLGTLATLATEPDAIAPIAGRRYVRATGNRITLPTGATCTLAPGSRVASARVVFDGSTLVAITVRRQAVLVSLSRASILQSVELRGELCDIAARRGLAVVRQGEDRIELIDLRLARSVGTLVVDRAFDAVAIDHDGRVLAIRDARGDVEVARLEELMAAKVAVVVAEPVAVAEPVVEPAAPEPTIAPTVSLPVPELPPVDVACLDPRPSRLRAGRPEALRALDREVRSVTLWTLRAIAHAWDSRQLGYGNEGKHPYEHEVAALLGMNSGFAPDYIGTAGDALEAHEQALAADPSYRAPAMPVAELAEELGLSARAIDILLVVAAPALYGEAARLYGILANDPNRAIVDGRLVEQILDGRVARHDVAAELHPRAPLVRLGIVEVRAAGPGPFAALAVDPVILARLRGEPPELGAAIAVRESDRALSELEIPRAVCVRAIEQVARMARPARIAVTGRAGSGRRALLAALAADARRSLGVIDASRLPRDVDRFARALALSLRRAQLAGLFPVLANLDQITFEDRDAGELAGEVCAAHPGPIAVIAAAGTPAPFPAGHVAIELPVLSEGDRASVWQQALARTPHWLRDEAGVAARYRVGPGTIHRAVAALADHDAQLPADDRIDSYLRQARDLRLAEHAHRVDRLATWSDLVLPPDIMDSVRELIGRVRHRKTVFEAWGMGRRMATSRGLTALFQGQPGTGKTLVAGAIARELGLDLYQVDLSKVMSKWIGETERNLATIFDAAEDGQVILLFDEADSLFAKRTEVRSSNDRYANLEVNYLLQRLDQFEGIAILTTNSGGSIDPAFKRRLSFRLSFPFPDEDTRAELWRAHLPAELPRAGELTFDTLARKYQISGGYIRNACLRAAFLAAQEETSLHQHHLERAVALEFAEMGKLSSAGAID